MKRYYLVVFSLIMFCLPTILSAQESPIGYLSITLPKPKGISFGLPQGDFPDGTEDDSSAGRGKGFDVYEFPDAKSEKIVTVNALGATRVLRVQAEPRNYQEDLFEPNRPNQARKLRLLVFEKKNDWVRVQFNYQPPYTGQDGWLKLGSGTGTVQDLE